MAKSNYSAYDRIYQHKRSAGQTGWDSPEVLKQNLEELARFLEGTRFPEHPSVLDMGCGAGDITLSFARKGWSAFGIDISACAIAWAQEKAQAEGLTATFVMADLSQALEHPVSLVDLALDSHCLHCMIGNDRRTFLRNASLHLRSESLLCINTMCGDPINPEVKKHFDPDSRCVVYNGIAGRFLGRPDEILGELVEAGYETIKHLLLSASDIDDQDTLLALARLR